MRRAADMVSRRVRINRSIKSEPHGVSLKRHKQRGVSITKYHGTKFIPVLFSQSVFTNTMSCSRSSLNAGTVQCHRPSYLTGSAYSELTF